MSVSMEDALGDGADKLSTNQGPPCQHSGLKALSAMARHTGLDWSLLRLIHVHGKDREPDAAELVRIAQAEGLKAKVHRTDWSRLERFQKLAPFLVRLNNGGYFVVLKAGTAAQGSDGSEQILLFNPLMPEANLFS